MLLHYLSLAWQQLEKYRLQSFVSIVSLAIGFACFALASMWIKYETTYDAFHKDAEGIYTILVNNYPFINERSIKVKHLEQIPEISEYSLFLNQSCKPVNQANRYAEQILLDDKFLDIFGVNFVEGNLDFMHDENLIAVSERFARRFWGNESPLGKVLVDEDIMGEEQPPRTVTAVFKDWGEHTNFPMDIMSIYPSEGYDKRTWSAVCVMRLYPSASADIVLEKLQNMMMRDGEPTYVMDISLKVLPITEIRHQSGEYKATAKFQINHIYLFSVFSMLLIVCGLLNYLTMFINRLFIRKREMALRKAFGASGWNLTAQFLTEYGLLLVIALAFGLLTVELSMDRFYEMSQLPVDAKFIYQETALYSAVVLLLSLAASVPVIIYFQRQSLQSTIVGVGGMMRYHIFRRISTGLQIGISIFCIFCVVVMMKQVDTLRYGDIGFKRENRGWIFPGENNAEELAFYLNQQPEVDTAIALSEYIYPNSYNSLYELKKEDNPEMNDDYGLHVEFMDETVADFYGLTLLQGRWPRPDDFRHRTAYRLTDFRMQRDLLNNTNVCINEILARRMGWENPIGKTFVASVGDNIKNTLTVIGVYKDILCDSPTEKAVPAIGLPISWERYEYSSVHFKFKPGTWPTLRQKIIDFGKEKLGWISSVEPRTYDEQYAPMLVSENNLQQLLNITTSVCILIALFGVWSMIMLTCEQRRKEIAVRKVFGATTKDILDMFFLEYMALQGVAALVAFPVGYACMKPWLEQYVVQTSIPWWIYVGIFLSVALLVALCVGWRVWKTATAHPADEIAKGRG